MNIHYSLNSIHSCLPLSRTELHEDVIVDRSHGNISHVWLGAGHMFVCLDGGKKLITFDTKTADFIQDVEDRGCLDITTDVPVLTVQTWPPKSVLVALQDGGLQHWVCRRDFTWKQQNEMIVTSTYEATIISLCVNVSHNSLYWCERIDEEKHGCKPVYSLHKRHIIEDESQINPMKLGPVTTLIKNCPASKVYPHGHGILVITESRGSGVSLCLRLCTLTGKIDVIIGREIITMTDVNLHTPVQFPQIIMRCLSQMRKLQGMARVVQSCYIQHTQTLLQLHDDGMLSTIAPLVDNTLPSADVQLEDFVREEIVGMVPMMGSVGVVYKNRVRVYNVVTGRKISESSLQEDYMVILGVCDTMLGGQQSGIYTEHDLYLLQKSSPTNHQPSDKCLLEMGHFQSDAIRLSYIDKMQRYTSTCSSAVSLESLRQKWIEGLPTPPTSKLAEIVEPFLTEYWKLENMLADGLSQPQMISEMPSPTVSDSVDQLLDQNSPISRSSRQSQILLLSQWYPDKTLAALLSHIHMGDDELSTSQQHKWQCVLSQENTDMPGGCDIAVPVFEIMCHLLYKRRPQLLIKFLQRGQQVWEKKIGVSAFIRRKQSLLVYERALKCIPEPEHSVDPERAIHVHVDILLISETDSCFLKATRLLLKYKKWAESIELLKEGTDDYKQYSLMYQVILTALTQNHILHKYADQIFPLMPNSCDDVLDSDVLDGDTASTTEVFCENDDEGTVSIHSVRPHLVQCLHANT